MEGSFRVFCERGASPVVIIDLDDHGFGMGDAFSMLKEFLIQGKGAFSDFQDPCSNLYLTRPGDLA